MASGLFVIGRGPVGGAMHNLMDTYHIGTFVSADDKAALAMEKLFHRSVEWKKIAAHNRMLAPLFHRDVQAELAVKQLKQILK